MCLHRLNMRTVKSETLLLVTSFKKGFITPTVAQIRTIKHFTIRCQIHSITITSIHDSAGRTFSVTVRFTIATTGQTGRKHHAKILTSGLNSQQDWSKYYELVKQRQCIRITIIKLLNLNPPAHQQAHLIKILLQAGALLKPECDWKGGVTVIQM